MRRFASALLDRTFGPESGQSILGDLEEDLTRHRCPGWAHRAPGLWLFWQSLSYVTACRADAMRGGFSLRPLEVTTMWYDVRDAVRTLRSTPAFTLVALVVLSLAIGASTAIFSVVDAVALRSLPFDQPDRLVQVGTVDARTGSFNVYQPPQNLADWKSRQDVFAAVAATRMASGFSIEQDGASRELTTMLVTPGYFDVYRAYPQIGRPLTEADAAEDRRVVLISDGLWRRHFGADAGVIGRSLQSTAALTYGAPMPVPTGTWTIVGVMPPGFVSPVGQRRHTDVWAPYVVPANQRTRDGARGAPLEITARLADGIGIDQADAQLRAITASLAAEHPAWFENTRGGVRSLHDATVGSVRSWMLLLLGAVGVVLAIACVNVANLTLARATARGREIQTRAALGASRWRIARSLLVESVVLSAAAMVLGVLIALWGIDVLRASLPESLPRVSTVALDLRVLGATAIVCLGTGLLFGLAPALHLSRPGASIALRNGSRNATAAGMRLRSALVVSEIALTLVLIIGSGLFLSSFVRVARVDIGIEPRNVLTMRVWPRFDSSQPGWQQPAITRASAAIPEMLDRIAAIPGVLSAGFVAGDLPMTGYSAAAEVIVRAPDRRFDGADRVQVRHVTPGYASAVGTTIVRGRYIEAGDVRGATPVVVLNEEAVARYFADREPLGATISIERGYAPQARVIGIVRNVRLNGPEGAVRPEAYLAAAQGQYLGGALAVRTAGDPLLVADAVRHAVRTSLPEAADRDVETMESLLGGVLAQRRFTMLIVSLFGALALAIAGAGLYGVMAYLVAQRTREMGVRLALGAPPSRLLSSVIGRGVRHVALGATIGLALAWPLASFVQPFLFQVRPHDPIVFIGATILLAVCGVTAAFVPARRAARVNPVIALTTE